MCTSLARVKDRGIDQCQASRKVLNRFGSVTPSQQAPVLAIFSGRRQRGRGQSRDRDFSKRSAAEPPGVEAGISPSKITVWPPVRRRRKRASATISASPCEGGKYHVEAPR